MFFALRSKAVVLLMGSLLAGGLAGCDNSSAPSPVNAPPATPPATPPPTPPTPPTPPVTPPTAGPSGSYTAAGTTMTATSPTANYMGTTLTIGLVNATNGVALTLTPVTGPGTISLASGGSLGLYSVGSTGSLASTGSVQITTFDTATRKVSGTFSFDATDLATGTVTHITNGTFSNLTF